MPQEIRLVIGGTDRTNKTRVNTVTTNRAVNGRSTMHCELIETAGVYRPVIGQQIFVEGTLARFHGFIEELDEEYIPGAFGSIAYRATCADFSRILDWRLYGGSFDAGTMFYDVVYTIWSAKLQAEGITLGNIAAGPALTSRIQDGLKTCTEWFRKLSTEFGYVFRVDEYKALHFGPLSTSPPNPAPFSISFGSQNWRDLKLNRKLGDFRDVQYVRTEYTVSGEITRQFDGDGSTRDFFQRDGPFAGVPVVTLDAVPLTVGIFGEDDPSLFDVLYVPEGWALHFVAPQAAPGAGEEIEATYRVRFNNSIMKQDLAKIAARAAIQGGSGVIEAIHEDRYIDTAAGLEARADALLNVYGVIPVAISFETDSLCEPNSDDLDPGMLLAVDLTDGPSDLDDVFLVESIESQWVFGARDDYFIHRINATNQMPYGDSLVGPIERLQEIARIGPDVGTLIDDSAESPVEVRPGLY